MESRVCPNAIMMATTGMVGQKVPLNQPSPSSLNSKWDGAGGGGICAGLRTASVRQHQTRKITTMTVVTCMMRIALVLDSCNALMLYHHNYSIARIAKKTSNSFGDKPNCSLNS